MMLNVEIKIYDTLVDTVYTGLKYQIAAPVCTITEPATQPYPQTLQIHVRQRDYTLSMPEWSISDECDRSDPSVFEVNNVVVAQIPATPIQGMTINSDKSITFSVTKAMFGQADFTIKYTITRWN